MLLLLLVGRDVSELLDFFDLLDLFLDEARKVGRLAIIVEQAFFGKTILGALRLAMNTFSCFGELNGGKRRHFTFLLIDRR